jgi:hypothetical protein
MPKFQKVSLTSKILSGSIVSCFIGLSPFSYLDRGLSQIEITKPISFAGSLAQTKQRKGEISAERMNIAGVKIYMTIAEVIKLLGKPKRQRIEKINTTEDGIATKESIVELFYSGLEIKLFTDSRSGKLSTARVFSVDLKTARYSTGDGIRIGDSQNKVIKTYGNPEESVVDAKKIISYWRKPYGTGGLSFEIQDKVVREISLSVSII